MDYIKEVSLKHVQHAIVEHIKEVSLDIHVQYATVEHIKEASLNMILCLAGHHGTH